MGMAPELQLLVPEATAKSALTGAMLLMVTAEVLSFVRVMEVKLFRVWKSAVVPMATVPKLIGVAGRTPNPPATTFPVIVKDPVVGVGYKTLFPRFACSTRPAV